MLAYLLKSFACMAIFLLFYQFVLEKERMHHFKRIFLLGALLASLIIPALVFTEYVEVTATTLAPTTNAFEANKLLPINKPVTDMDVVNWTHIWWPIYSLGVFLFGFRFAKHLYQILQRIRNNPKLKLNTITQVLLKEKIPPHTFFHYIFLNKEAMNRNAIPKEVLIHEETHAKQWHSLDVLFIELFQIVFWFNPLIVLFKKNIKLNHEFLADSAVLKENIPTRNYQNTLLSFLSATSERRYQSVKMANTIIYSSTRAERSRSIKKRFKIMKKQTSKTSVVLRTFLLLPIVALLLYSFSKKKTIPREFPSTPISIIDNFGDRQFVLLIDNSKIFLNGLEVALDAFAKEVDKLTMDWKETDYTSIPVQANFSKTPLLFLESVEKEFQKTHFSKSNEGMKIFPDGYENKIIQKAASREQMKEYNVLAKKYNEMSRENMRVKMKEVARMKYIYGLMSDKQRADAEPFPDFPESPPHLETAMVEELSSVAPEFVSPPHAPIDEIKEVPPPPFPPTPVSPLDHAIEMAKKGATFYYEGKEVSSDRAIELLKTNESLNIESTKNNSKNPQVRISKDPITIKKE